MTIEIACIVACLFPAFILAGATLIQVWQNRTLSTLVVEMGRALLRSTNPTAVAIHEQMQGRVALEEAKQNVQSIIRAKKSLNAESIKEAHAEPRRTILLRPNDQPPLSPWPHVSAVPGTTGRSET